MNTTATERKCYIRLTNETLVLLARREWAVRSLVAGSKLRRLGNSVVVGIPHEGDSITDGCVDNERNIAENTLGGSNNDGVGNTRSARGS